MWNLEPSAEALKLVDEAIRAGFPPGASEAEITSMKMRYGRGLAEQLEREIQKRRLTSMGKAKPPLGLSVLLRADPNPDFAPEKPEAQIKVPGLWISVSSLRGAQELVRTFIWAWKLGGGNWTGGDLANDGAEFARISYNARILTADGKEILASSDDPRHKRVSQLVAEAKRVGTQQKAHRILRDARALLRELAEDPSFESHARSRYAAEAVFWSDYIEPSSEVTQELAKHFLAMPYLEKEDRQKIKDRVSPPRKSPTPKVKTIPFSTQRHKVNPSVKQAIDEELKSLSVSERPDALVKAWSELTAERVNNLLVRAGKKKIGAVIELVRRIQRERPDLDIRAALAKHGTLNERGNAIVLGTGITLGLGLAREETARILWAERYLQAMGEL